METLLLQLITLSLFVIFMGFCFCDGFGLHILRKLLWFAVFLAMVVYTMNTKGSFELTSILPVPIVFAFILCAYEKARKKQK